MEDNPALALFLAIAVIILASRLGGALARKLRQPRVLGELLVGVLLGPTFLHLLHWPIFHGVPLEETIKELAELGVILLMFLIGFEVNVKGLMSLRRVAIFAGALGALLPVALSFAVMVPFGYSWQSMLFVGVTLAATSVSISAQVLFELGFLRTREGTALLATALIDDVLAILLVSLAVALVNTGDLTGGALPLSELALILLRMTLYIGLAAAISWFVLPLALNRLARIPEVAGSYGMTAVSLILILFFAWAAEEWGGVAGITGAFLCGLGLGRTRETLRETIEESTSAIAYGFLVPIFFVDVGLEADLSGFPLSALPFTLLLLVMAILSKLVGCGLGGLLGGFKQMASLRLGVCMISRGEVGLIIASLGLNIGVFQRDDPLFAAVFMVILLTTLVAPVLVRLVFLGDQPPRSHSHALT